MFWKTPTIKMIVIILLVIIVIAAIVLFAFMHEFSIRIRPEQHEQAEVVGKRIRTRTSASEGTRTYTNHIITFKFLDDTEKELAVKPQIYEFMREGETGVLSYQEKKNGTNWSQRYFISFEKDS